ncbi:beta-xylosidase [Paenibacillus terrae HPL-003]|uniref:Beta-xylosidase n=1 Tax=Paenibacillus terrae (strain HPL-003) TaxID=985665 RepID=G7W4U8_PAETH|nr:beta-xylosidase [Paenibacillus terrae HPL-003]
MIRRVAANGIKKGFLITLVLLLMIAGSALGMSDASAALSEQKGKQDAPAFSEVSVHDPSIVKDGDTYYVFGSHISAAKSKDLKSWTSFANGYTTPGNTLFGDLSKNLAGSFAWAGENDSDSKGGFSVWAPDVFWNEHYVNDDGTKGAYMIYYSASSTYIRSAIGVAVAPQIEGPYQYVDTIVYTGFTKETAYDKDSKVDKKWTNTPIQQLVDQGKLQGPRAGWFNADGSYANRMFPNAIDPAIFYDTEGRLWMTYGSWSGGIFLLELDKATGKPIYPGQDGATEDGRLIDRYFGTKIAGGYGESGEGPYIEYNKETGYYYLFVTYGGLASDGGYNMRLFRSKNPSGPYKDAKGQNAVLPANTKNAAFGNKLIGNFLFNSKMGDPGEGIGYGYVSPGHNSAYTDPDNGQMFVVFHTRFPQQGEKHELRIHQMLMNQEGWPVVAPYRYGGETLTELDEDQVVGDYQYVNHGSDTSAVIKQAQFIQLKADHTVAGELQGTWRKVGDTSVKLTLGGTVYDGVFIRQWDDYTKQYVMTFTVASKTGEMAWGSQFAPTMDATVVESVYGDLALGDTSRVVANLSLPKEGSRQTSITWKSSDSSVISDTGEVKRPEIGEKAVSATLTATISKGESSKSKAFNITVSPYEKAMLTAQYKFENNLEDSEAAFANGEVIGDRIDREGGTVTYTEGTSGQAVLLDGKSGIKLPQGMISSSAYSVSLWVHPSELTLHTPTFFGAMDSNHWISLLPKGPEGDNTMLWSGSSPWYTGSTGMKIKANEWTHLAFTVDNGLLSVYVDGKPQFTGTGFPDVLTSKIGTFSLGVNWWDPAFKGAIDELSIFKGALPPSQVAELAKVK